jgi:hypothetical protein
MTAMLDPSFASLCDDAKLEINLEGNNVPKFRNWCLEVGLLDIAMFGLAAATEADVETKIIAKFVEHNRADVSIGEKSKYKLLWRYCREAMTRGDHAGSHAIDDNKPMSQPEATTLKMKWKDKHGFVFSAGRSLAPLIQAKMFKHATASPKQFVVLHPEELKLMTAFVKTDFTTLQFAAGQLPQAINVNIEAVTAISTFRNKIEAQFNMWAFVSIQDPSWFSYQDTIFFMDIINEFFQKRWRGATRPSLDFYKGAYVKTMNHFLEAVSTHERKLSEVVKDVSSWSTAWTAWDPPHVNPYGKGAKGADAASSDVVPRHLSRVMNKMGKMALGMKNTMGKQYGAYGAGKGQWQQDRYQPYQPYNPEWTTPKQESDKGGGKEKGKGKGKGKKGKKGNSKKGGW